MRICKHQRGLYEIDMRCKKIPTQNHQKKTTTIFWHINRADGLEKQILSGKFVVPKAEEDNAQNTQTV